MKAPKCPKCGKEHYSTQRCSAVGEPVAVARSPKPTPGGSTPPTFANAPSSSGRTAGLGPANGGSNPPGATSSVAERMKDERDWAVKVNRESSSAKQDAPVIGEVKGDGHRPTGAMSLGGKAVHSADRPLTNEESRETVTASCTPPETAIEGEAKRKTAYHRPQPVGADTAKALDCGSHEVEVGSSTEQALKMAQALTPAEKQKAYRKRLKADPVKWLKHLESERLRKANKLRMRKKRETGER